MKTLLGALSQILRHRREVGEVERKLAKWISHRGVSEGVTENTKGAFDAALDCGFDAIETDLRMTADGEIVLSHDADLGRVGKLSIGISESSAEQLRRIVLPCGGRLMFVDEFIERYSGVDWVFDVKPEGGQETLRVLGEKAVQQGWVNRIEEKVRFTLWKSHHRKLVLDYFPKAKFYATERSCYRAGVSVLMGVSFLGGIRPDCVYSLPPRLGPVPLFRRSIVNRYHDRGAQVLAYLPGPEDVDAALSAGVDELLVDFRRF